MSNAAADASEDPDRRDFIHIIAGAMAVGGAAAVAWPLIDQMDPAANVLSAGSAISFDLSKVQPGQQVVVQWQSKPIFIVNRTPAILAQIQKPSDLDRLRDPNSDNMQQPDYAKNWSRSIRPEYLVLVGICTHLGCIPNFNPSPGGVDPTWPGGWLCPCHGSKYDLAGRVFKSVPAPLNLPVPPYHFAGDTTLVIGEDPPGSNFSLAEVQSL